VERQQWQAAAKFPDGRAQPAPGTAQTLQQAYGVFREDDEVAVRIRSNAALGRRRAEAIERFQSSPVIVAKVLFGGCFRELSAPEMAPVA
jgi:hypothetical protein